VRRTLPSLNAAKAFEATARHLSFTEAAVELSVTQGAVSRQVKALEVYLGRQLLRRGTRSVELTEEGARLAAALGQALDRIEAAVMAARGGTGAGIVTINVLPIFSMYWLVPRLPLFAEEHPEIEIRMINAVTPVDFDREEIDLAIRVGRLATDVGQGLRSRRDMVAGRDWSDVAYQTLLPGRLVPVCSPALLADGRAIREPADLASWPLLHTIPRAQSWARWFREQGLNDPDPGRRRAFGHYSGTLQAAVAGEGVAIVPEVLVQKEIAGGSLIIPIEGAPERDPAHYYLLGRREQWDSAPVRAFRTWLQRQASSFTASPAPARSARA